MAQFSYRGRDQSGELVSGSVDATSSESVAGQLMDNGITPIAIEQSKEPVKFAMPQLWQRKISLEELIIFTRQMHSLTRAGVVMNRAFRGLSQSVNNDRLREILADIERSLNSGISLSVSMRRHEDVFNNLYVSIIQVGENSGRLDSAFKQLVQYLELEKDTRRRVSSAVRYPIFVFSAIAIAVVVLNIYVIPVFAELFAKFNSELPLPTRILIATSSFFVNYWPWLLAFLITAIFALRYYLQTPEGELRWDRRKIRLPLIGGILERATLARFGRSFALMLKSGVPLMQALDLCAQAVGNSYLAQKVRGMREGVQRGESLLRTAANSEMFTPLVLQMIQVGEETGQVDDMLEEVALFYEEEVDYDLKNLSSYIEPILIVCIAGLVMMLALGIFLPMWDMMSVMQGK